MILSPLLLLALTGSSAAALPADRYFTITVVDEATGRGVPMVELTTTNSVRYYTDSNGIVAYHEPGLMGQRVHFQVKSHGYEFPKDGFGYAGRALDVVEGGSATLKIKRINIAERLYRITGQGIYRDTILVGGVPPTPSPVINGLVMGQDSVQNAVYRGKLWWFWGDTGKPDYPLGNFHMSGATSPLPDQGALDPDRGVALSYFVREGGFAKEMAPRPEPGPVWLDGLVVLPDETGRERLYAAYTRVNPQMEALERGIMRFNDDREIFEKVVETDLKASVHPGGHPFIHTDGDQRHIYFPHPFPHVRVEAEVSALLDLSRYEAYTCLRDGSSLDSPQIDRGPDGEVRYAWRRNTPPIEPKRQEDLIKAGELKEDEVLLQLRDVDTGKAVAPHSGCVYYNAHRGRWITIRSEIMGSSMLGEIWYAEADTPVGPWVYARKVVTHEKYSFYNPKQHPVYDREGGRIIYFEGTYTEFVSGAPERTPRYDYNQIMYKLDLDDARLVLPVPVYRLGKDEAGLFRTRASLPANHRERSVPFFAPDRPAEGLVPVFEVRGVDGATELRVGPDTSGQLLFYALPADTAEPPATAVPLHVFADNAGSRREYHVEQSNASTGLTRQDKPLCLVWRSPTRLRWE